MDVNLWLVTGWRGAGKSTFCREMLLAARAAGWEAAGMLSPGVFHAGRRECILAEDVRSGETRLLAAFEPRPETDLPFGRLHFSQAALAWGNQVLLASIPCDLLVVDELGPLEFNQASGWVGALDVLRTGQFRLALVVIRPELLATAQALLQPSQVIEINGVDDAHAKARQYASWFAPQG